MLVHPNELCQGRRENRKTTKMWPYRFCGFYTPWCGALSAFSRAGPQNAFNSAIGVLDNGFQYWRWFSHSFLSWRSMLVGAVVLFQKLLRVDDFSEMRDEKEDEHKPTDQYDAQTNLKNARDDISDHEGTHSPNTATNSVSGPTILPVSVSSHAPLPSNQPQLPMYKRDLYKFPWFRGLLGLMALMLTTLYVFLLGVSSILGSALSSTSLSYEFLFLVPQYWLPVHFWSPDLLHRALRCPRRLSDAPCHIPGTEIEDTTSTPTSHQSRPSYSIRGNKRHLGYLFASVFPHV